MEENQIMSAFCNCLRVSNDAIILFGSVNTNVIPDLSQNKNIFGRHVAHLYLIESNAIMDVLSSIT